MEGLKSQFPMLLNPGGISTLKKKVSRGRGRGHIVLNPRIKDFASYVEAFDV